MPTEEQPDWNPEPEEPDYEFGSLDIYIAEYDDE